MCRRSVELASDAPIPTLACKIRNCLDVESDLHIEGKQEWHMYRWPITFLGTMALMSCLAAAQDSSSAMFSSDLIAWSGMQQPTAPEQQPQRQQPTPDPNPQSQPAPG